MRIISGTYKGRHIPVRKNFTARPTTDFAKENLFNILHNYFTFEELSVLDLFSGTGSISYEFASRGARVDLIEIDYRSVQFIRSTIELLQLNTITPFRADVFKVIGKLTGRYDIVFADPPYQLQSIPSIPNLILEKELLNTGGWLILEHSGSHSFRQHPRFKEIRTYGSVNFTIFI